MRKNKLFTALAAATLLIGTGADLTQAANPTTVQAAKKTKKAKKAKKTKRYKATFKRKPALYELVTKTKDGKKVSSIKKVKSKKIKKAIKFKKGSKTYVFFSLTTNSGAKFYYLGRVKVGKKNHLLYVKSKDVKVKSKKIPNYGEKAKPAASNQTISLKNPTFQEFLDTQLKSFNGTVKQDTENLFTIDSTNNKPIPYVDANKKPVKWAKGKQFKIYAKTDFSVTNKNSGQNYSIPVYETIFVDTNDKDNPIKYVFIPTELVDLDNGVQASQVTDLKDLNLNDSYTKWRNDTLEKEKQDYLNEQKAKQEQAQKEAAAKKKAAKKAKKAKKSKKKSSKKNKKTAKKAKKAKKAAKK